LVGEVLPASGASLVDGQSGSRQFVAA